MSGRTPGTWRATKHTDTKGWTVSAGGNSIASVKGPAAEANARLMAAAPELLEACRALANRADATSECDHARLSCEEIGCIGFEVKRARAAIAKAEGRP